MRKYRWTKFKVDEDSCIELPEGAVPIGFHVSVIPIFDTTPGHESHVKRYTRERYVIALVPKEVKE